jgi:hypothetical protein
MLQIPSRVREHFKLTVAQTRPVAQKNSFCASKEKGRTVGTDLKLGGELEMCDTGLAKLEESLRTTETTSPTRKKIIRGKRARGRNVRVASKPDLLSPTNSSSNLAIFAAIRRASRRRDGICGDVIQSGARGWGVL